MQIDKGTGHRRAFGQPGERLCPMQQNQRREHCRGYIYLYENTNFEIGKGNAYSSWSDAGLRGIDNSQLVYPIRGTVDSYSCRPPGSMGFPAGKNCNVRKAGSVTGSCFKTAFGDWNCQGKLLGDPLAGVVTSVAPPK